MSIDFMCTQSMVLSDKPGSHICNGDNRRYVCAMYGKGYGHAHILRFHNMIHTGEKPHLCQLCGKGFVTSSELKKRGLSHTGEKLHTCRVWGKGYRAWRSTETITD